MFWFVVDVVIVLFFDNGVLFVVGFVVVDLFGGDGVVGLVNKGCGLFGYLGCVFV